MTESAALLVLAGALLAWSGDLKKAAGAAGFTLLGAGVVRAFDGFGREREKQASADAARRRDLDETRRLLYMALAIRGGTAARPLDLAGTLSNALAHHSKMLTVAEAETLGQAVAGGATIAQPRVEQFQDLVAAITTELGDFAPS